MITVRCVVDVHLSGYCAHKEQASLTGKVVYYFYRMQELAFSSGVNDFLFGCKVDMKGDLD